jgi:citrate synthase
VHSGDIRVDVQSALAMLAPFWGLDQLLDIDDDRSATTSRASVMALSFVAQSARLGWRWCHRTHRRRLDHYRTIHASVARRPGPCHVKAVDAYWCRQRSTA